jgi:hypothetical protein
MQLVVLILALVLSLLLFFPAMACTRRRTFHVHRATATVTAATCSPTAGGVDVPCDLVLSYTPSGGTLQTGIELSTEGDSFSVGDTLTVYYDPGDIRHVSLYPIRPSDDGSYMLLIGAVLILTLPFLFEK